MPLNKEQRQAVEYLDGPLLVLAGPGTGKTQLLSSKVAYILENTDAAPENILCITFTEAATANMLERLTSIIGPAAHHVNIHTYHAFGTDILKQYKNYSATFTRPLDDAIDDVAAFKIIRDLQKTLDPFDPLRANSIKDILDTISSAKKARLSPEDLIKISQDNRDRAEKFVPQISEILLNLPPRQKYQAAVENTYLPILEILAKYISEDNIAAEIEPLPNYLARELKSAIDGEKDKEKPSVQPLTKWKNAHFEIAPDGSFRLKDHIANKKLESLAKIYAEYQNHLEKNGLYDFDDMIEEAIRVLKEDEGFRLSLSEKYQYILLDEFQDTNPSQFQIIRLLTDYEKPCLMAVGDDDQTIFEFQGARPDNLIDFQKHYNAKVINLNKNYRSTAEIVALGRAIATKIPDSFEKQLGITKELIAMRGGDSEPEESVIVVKEENGQVLPPETVPEKSITATREKNEPEESVIADSAEVTTEQIGGSPVTTGRADRCPQDRYPQVRTSISRIEFTSADAEYSWLAKEIRDLISAGTPPREIGVITPQHKFIQPLLPYLKEQNIPISYEKSENILEDTKIKELTTLSEFIFALSQAEQPAHRLLEILSFPFWELPAEIIIKNLAENKSKSTLSILTESSDPKLKEIGQLLAELTKKSAEAPLEKFLDLLIGIVDVDDNLRSPFLSFYEKSEDYAAFNLYNNLFTLREKAIAHTKAQSPKLKDFINFLRDYQEAGAAITSTSPYQDADDSVQLMTVHKSKGLEFDHVFLIAVDDDNWGNAKGNRNLLSLPKNLLSIRQDGTSESELMRKFFVAITRAKTHLTMTNSIKNYAGKTPPRLEYLSESADESGALLSPLLPSGKATTMYEDLPAAEVRTDLHSGWLAHYFELTPSLKDILKKRLENYKLTATDLTSFIDILYSGPADFYKKKILRAPAEPPTASLNLGNLVHATFEKVTKEGITDAEALAFCEEQVLALPLDSAEQSELSALAERSLKKSLKKFAPILREDGALAELDFYAERPALGDIPLAGKIDHLSINDKDKTIEVYDFKTNKHQPNKWHTKSNTTLYKFRSQLGFYKLLLNLSPSYSKYTVTRGHILYVKPDADGEVYDEPYDFNEKDEAELKSLIKVVYHHIKTLDFLDDPELNLESDSSLPPKAMFNFIEKLLQGSSS